MGFEAPETQPHQCLEISLPVYSPPGAGPDPTPRVCISGNGARNAVLEMAELTDPTCAIATEPDAVDHFRLTGDRRYGRTAFELAHFAGLRLFDDVVSVPF